MKKYFISVAFIVFYLTQPVDATLLKDDITGSVHFFDTRSICELNNRLLENSSDCFLPVIKNIGAGFSVIATGIFHFAGNNGSIFNIRSEQKNQSAGINTGAYNINDGGSIFHDRTIFDIAILASVFSLSSKFDFPGLSENIFAIVPVNPFAPAVSPFMEKTGPNPLAREKFGLYFYYSKGF